MLRRSHVIETRAPVLLHLGIQLTANQPNTCQRVKRNKFLS